MIEELQKEIDFIQEIYQFVEDFRDKKITISKFMKGPDVLARKEEEYLEEFMEAILGEIYS
jgi:hypothetical protein